MKTKKTLHSGFGYRIFVQIHAISIITYSLVGCTATSSKTTTPVEVKRDAVVARNLRLTYDFENKKAAFFQKGHAVEFGYSSMSGNSDQIVVSGQKPVILNQIIFNGPQQIRNEFDFVFYEFQLRYRDYFNERYGFEISAGTGFPSVLVSSSSNAQFSSRKYDSFGARIEFGLHYFLSQTSSIQARAKFYEAPFFTSGNPSVMNFRNLELVYATSLHDNFSMRAGISHWKVIGYDDREFWDAQFVNHPSNSDIELEYLGPTITLNLEF